MKHYIILFLIGFLITNNTYSLQAQWTISLGVGCTNTVVNKTSLIESKRGNVLNILVKKDLSNSFSVGSGLELIQKNHLNSKNNLYRNTYLQIPIRSSLHIIQKNKIKTSVNTGFFVGYWLKEKIKKHVPNIFQSSNLFNSDANASQLLSYESYSRTHNFNNKTDNRFEYGIIVGSTISYQYNKQLSIFLEPNYYHALSAMQKRSYPNTPRKRNRTLVVLLGCTIHLKK